MGAGASVDESAPVVGALDKSSSSEQFSAGKEALKERRLKRDNIFDRQSISNINRGDGGGTDLEDGDEMDHYEYEIVSKSLLNFFFMQQSDAQMAQNKMDSLVRRMKREKLSGDAVLITEGESGNKLYVVESGELDVYINGEIIRTMTQGCMLGELALLYDAPRTATVRCKTDCVLWSLTRRIFKHTQAEWGIALQVERSRGLISSPELAVLSAIDLSRLTASLKNSLLANDAVVFEEGKPSQDVVLIEHGKMNVYSKSLAGLDTEEFERRACIFRKRVAGKLAPIADEPSELEGTDHPLYGAYMCTVDTGTLLGIGALRSKAKIADGWRWVGQEADPSKFAGAECPFTAVVVEAPFEGQTFSVEAFENLFGSASDVLRPGGAGAAGKKGAVAKKQETKFDGTKFKMKHVLGSGSFGVVILAEYRDSREATPALYALKCLSKFAVIETGQLRHVLDERKLLALMDSPFVLKLHGTYQTPHQLVMVTEALDCGDLWSIIYESPPSVENHGLTNELVKFYAASLVLALDHVHGRGVVFRDLKPENIILDSKGYIRLIDFGFAKKVPFTKIGPDGKEQVYAKTYTLCGTPEYLAPELIFNLGHDQMTDIWALGVLVHEMVLMVTPFAPKKHDNVTELFTNIALVKKSGLKLSPRLDRKYGSGDASSLITQLLSPEPELRTGKQGASTRKILNHSIFKDFDLQGLMNLSMEPTYVPVPSTKRDPISGLQPVKSFNGDQKVFVEF